MNNPARLSAASILLLLFFSGGATAEIYKCTKDGKTSFSDKPCTGEQVIITQQIEEKMPPKPAESANSSWKFHRSTDEMTGKNICLAVSPNIIVGVEGRDILAATLRVTGSSLGPIVGLKSERLFKEHPKSFHNDIDGLGIKIGDNAFIPFDEKSGSSVLGFSSEKSRQIVEQLATGNTFRLRLRYWPYEKTYDSTPQENTSFAAVFEQVKECDEPSNATKADPKFDSGPSGL